MKEFFGMNTNLFNFKFMSICYNYNFNIKFHETYKHSYVVKELTFLSISLSHISFIVQPAPLIITAPKPNKPSISKFGSSPAAEAKAMLHVQGQYNSNHPKIQ